jgi:hypothetical protein
VNGARGDAHADTGYSEHVMNFAFNSLYDIIPSRGDGTLLYFDVRRHSSQLAQADVHAKMRNFYKAHEFIKQYPSQRKLSDTINISEYLLSTQVMPTIYSMAEHINFMDPQLRFWEFNHCEHFMERVTAMCDGYPVVVSWSQNRFVQRLLKSGKYTEYVVKGEMVNTLCGFPFEHTGGHLAIRHDARMHKENIERRRMIRAWEYWLGDKAYVGCPEFLTEFKKPRNGQLTPEHIEWNLLLQHYRGRNEHLVQAVKGGRRALCTSWRGSYSGICAVMKVTAHMVALQERMAGPRYDCYGPWPMCPAEIVSQF